MSKLLEELPKAGNPDWVLDYKGILAVLPHRYPFLLVDAVTELVPGKSIAGLKNVTFNEPFFSGHFPGEPVMPGVLQIEAMAQIATVLVLVSFEEAAGKRPAFAGIEDARFRVPVRPGDQLKLYGEVEKFRRGFGVFLCRATVGQQVVAEAKIKATMV